MKATTPEKILVLTEQFKNSDKIFEPLREAGYVIEVNESFRLPDEAKLIGQLQHNIFTTIAGGEPYTAKVFQQTETLKIVARWGAGYDKVDVPAHCRRCACCYGIWHQP